MFEGLAQDSMFGGGAVSGGLRSSSRVVEMMVETKSRKNYKKFLS